MRRAPTGWLLVLAGAIVLGGCASARAYVQSTRTLPVTPGLEAALLRAGAAAHRLPVADFTGLATGLTYYAYDQGEYWAAARLVPRTTSRAAQVSVQDDGGYDVFTRFVLHGWTAYDDGLGTIAGTRCAVVVPTAVRIAWHWSPYTPCGGPSG
jgi:hypothetical protein